MGEADALREVPGVPESALGDALAARLPGGSPDAPWATRAQAVVWWHRAAPGAAATLPDGLRDRRVLPVTVGAFIRYLDTPVGPYDEVLASPVALLGGRGVLSSSLPFIAVDSLASIHGGRDNWALPKTLARFRRAPADAPRRWRADAARDAGTPPWSVEVALRRRPRRIPLRLALGNRQAVDGGSALTVVGIAGAAQLARVTVAAAGPTLPTWLLRGPHPALWLPDAQLTFAPPQPDRRDA